MSRVTIPSAIVCSMAATTPAEAACSPSESSRSAPAQTVAIGFATFMPRYFGAEPWIGSNIEVPPGLMLPPGGEPEPALDHRAEVGDDVAEHVRRDHDVEPLRVLDEPHGDRVHEGVLGRDGGVRGRDVGEDLAPEPVDVREDVRLVDRRDLPLPPLGELERVLHHPARPLAGHDPDLVREFLRVGLDVEPELHGVERAEDLELGPASPWALPPPIPT